MIDQQILELYNSGNVTVTALNQQFGKLVVNHALKNKRRSPQAAQKIARKLLPESYKLTDETKQKISQIRKKYIADHPEKIPYFNKPPRDSWPEKIFENALQRHNITDWVKHYRIFKYEYDFAFPLLKIDVEIDGSMHKEDKDKIRDDWSKSQQWTVIRFKAKHVLRDVESCISLLKKYLESNSLDIQSQINTSFLATKGQNQRNSFSQNNQLEASSYIQNQINESFLMTRTQGERNKILNQQKQQEKKQAHQKLQQDKIDKILQSGIDFSSFGWVKQVAHMTNTLPQKVNKWMKKNMPDFYENNCFKRAR